MMMMMMMMIWQVDFNFQIKYIKNYENNERKEKDLFFELIYNIIRLAISKSKFLESTKQENNKIKTQSITK